MALYGPALFRFIFFSLISKYDWGKNSRSPKFSLLRIVFGIIPITVQIISSVIPAQECALSEVEGRESIRGLFMDARSPLSRGQVPRA